MVALIEPRACLLYAGLRLLAQPDLSPIIGDLNTQTFTVLNSDPRTEAERLGEFKESGAFRIAFMARNDNGDAAATKLVLTAAP